ncbi:hypothetical protein [Sphingomonas sp. UYP23]
MGQLRTGNNRRKSTAIKLNNPKKPSAPIGAKSKPKSAKATS